jgi:nitrogen fixation protein NifB
MNMMRHCRQCRADAVGLLGEDRGEEFSMKKVETMEIDYGVAMQRRKEVHAAIEANRAAQAKTSGESFIALASIGTRKKTWRPVLIAVATTGGGVINQHFGHAREFLVYEASATAVRFIGHRKVDIYCSGGDSCGDAETALSNNVCALEGCEVVLCSKIGYEPWGLLEAAGIQPNGEYAMEPIDKAVAAVYREMAESGALDAPAVVKRRATA